MICQMLLRLGVTLLIGSLGGLLFATIHSPLPWMLGSLVATAVVSILGVGKLWVPRWLRGVGLVVVGISLGLRMTPTIWEMMSGHLGLMLIATVVTLLFGLINTLILQKVGKVDVTTAFFSNVPGGLSEMVATGEKMGGNVQIISIFHSIRLTTLAIGAPFLVTWLGTHSPAAAAAASPNQEMAIGTTLFTLAIGSIAALLAVRVSIPSPHLLGPLFLIAALSLNTPIFPEGHVLPGSLIQLAQIFIGVSTGTQFSRESIRQNTRMFGFALVHAFLLMAMSFSLALSIAYLTRTDASTNILAMAPGGITEMSLMALAVGADPLLVTAFQLFRVLFILIAVSYGVRLWAKLFRKRKEEFG